MVNHKYLHLKVSNLNSRNHPRIQDEKPQLSYPKKTSDSSRGGFSKGSDRRDRGGPFRRGPISQKKFWYVISTVLSQSQNPVGGQLAHFAPIGMKSQTTNGPSLLWKEDTKSYSRKYLLLQKTSFSSNKLKGQNWKKRSTVSYKKRAVEEILLESPGYCSRILKKKKKKKQEWKNEAHNRSFHSEQICSSTRLRNGDSEKKSEIQFVPTIGHFHWIWRMLICMSQYIRHLANISDSLWRTKSSNSEFYHLACQGAHTCSRIWWK